MGAGLCRGGRGAVGDGSAGDEAVETEEDETDEEAAGDFNEKDGLVATGQADDLAGDDGDDGEQVRVVGLAEEQFIKTSEECGEERGVEDDEEVAAFVEAVADEPGAPVDVAARTHLTGVLGHGGAEGFGLVEPESAWNGVDDDPGDGVEGLLFVVATDGVHVDGEETDVDGVGADVRLGIFGGREGFTKHHEAFESTLEAGALGVGSGVAEGLIGVDGKDGDDERDDHSDEDADAAVVAQVCPIGDEADADEGAEEDATADTAAEHDDHAQRDEEDGCDDDDRVCWRGAPHTNGEDDGGDAEGAGEVAGDLADEGKIAPADFGEADGADSADHTDGGDGGGVDLGPILEDVGGEAARPADGIVDQIGGDEEDDGAEGEFEVDGVGEVVMGGDVPEFVVIAGGLHGGDADEVDGADEEQVPGADQVAASAQVGDGDRRGGDEAERKPEPAHHCSHGERGLAPVGEVRGVGASARASCVIISAVWRQSFELVT